MAPFTLRKYNKIPLWAPVKTWPVMVRKAIREVSWFLKFLVFFLDYAPTRMLGGAENLGRKAWEPICHHKVVMGMALSESAFEDSGYWDYALLMFYDEFAHTIVFSGLTALTGFGWAERAALLTSTALSPREAQTIENAGRSLGQAFIAMGRNLIILTLALALVLIQLSPL